MPENNEYELDENYEPLEIVDAADGSGTTWTEFIEQVNKMDNQVAALTVDSGSRFQTHEVSVGPKTLAANAVFMVRLPHVDGFEPISVTLVCDSATNDLLVLGCPVYAEIANGWFVRILNVDKNQVTISGVLRCRYQRV